MIQTQNGSFDEMRPGIAWVENSLRIRDVLNLRLPLSGLGIAPSWENALPCPLGRFRHAQRILYQLVDSDLGRLTNLTELTTLSLNST